MGLKDEIRAARNISLFHLSCAIPKDDKKIRNSEVLETLRRVSHVEMVEDLSQPCVFNDLHRNLERSPFCLLILNIRSGNDMPHSIPYFVPPVMPKGAPLGHDLFCRPRV